MRCVNCDKASVDLLNGDLLRTAYGDYLCENCWDDYICTDYGKLEYLIGIYNNDYPASDFDADFLGEVAESWRTNVNMLDLTAELKFNIEQKAKKLGLL